MTVYEEHLMWWKQMHKVQSPQDSPAILIEVKQEV